MARQRMVTRTINVTEATVLCIDILTHETCEKVYELTGVSYTYDSALKALKKEYDYEEFKLVAVTNLTTREEMFGMSELQFIMLAEKLDPTTRKAIEESNDENDDIH